jgi:hypothetical protein
MLSWKVHTPKHEKYDEFVGMRIRSWCDNTKWCKLQRLGIALRTNRCVLVKKPSQKESIEEKAEEDIRHRGRLRDRADHETHINDGIQFEFTDVKK